MRRFFLVLLLIALLSTTVHAAGASSLNSDTTVDENGSCHVTLTLSLVLEAGTEKLTFPVPEKARDITLNGSAARSSHSDQVRNVDISGAVAGAGSYTVVLRYSLPDAVTADKEGKLTLTLPLLCGFSYPIEQMAFSVTLPGPVEARPSFVSTYYQEAAESVMAVTRKDNVISGTVNKRVEDHESITMTLAVTEQVFPQSMAKRFSLDTVDVLMITLSALTLVYYLASMCAQREKRRRTTTPPAGMSAGETALKLTGRGLDLPLMVLSWGQMGYLLIQPDDNGRVLLHKRMDMGNERSELENRYFRSLFGKRSILDATGYHFARLSTKAAASCPGRKHLYRRSSGSSRVLRILSALVGTLGGVSHACAFVQDTAWRIVLGIFLGGLTTVLSWLIQGGAKSIYNRDKLPLYAAVLAGVVWLLPALLCGEWLAWLLLVPAQFLAGFAAYYGGRRTEAGKQDYAQLLDLRRYLKSVPAGELKQIQQYNPDYYYSLAPYALALGVNRSFARQMGSLKLPPCSYLTTGMDGHMTAQEFDRLLESTVEAMDLLRRRMPIDKLLGR